MLTNNQELMELYSSIYKAPSVILDTQTHSEVTKALRQEMPYGSNYNMKMSQIETYYSNVYGGAFDHDDWLDVMFH